MISADFTPKITDFGLSKLTTTQKNKKKKSKMGKGNSNFKYSGSTSKLITNTSPIGDRRGMSVFGADQSVIEGTSMIGTPRYMAPEIIDGSTGYTKSVDIYSFGLLMYYCITKQVPFKSKRVYQVFSTVRSGLKPIMKDEYKKKFGNDEIYCKIVGVMQRCWQFRAEDRPRNFKIVSVGLQ